MAALDWPRLDDIITAMNSKTGKSRTQRVLTYWVLKMMVNG